MALSFYLAYLVLLGIGLSYAQQISGSACLIDNSWHLVPHRNASCAAYAIYSNTINETGWATIDVATNAAYDDLTQAFAAGFLEGALNKKLINQSIDISTKCHGLPPKAVFDWIENNYEWIVNQVAPCLNQRRTECEYWNHVNLLLQQLDGLVSGAFDVRDVSSPQFKEARLNMLVKNAEFEVGDILTALNMSTIHENPRKSMKNEHCSVLIKLTDDYSNLYASHVTWGDFCDMLRMFKNYRFHFHNYPEASSVHSFSSYPGVLASGDDYYLTDKGLFVAETTNNVFNKSLFEAVTTKTVPFWIRVLLANRLASTGKEWTTIFAMYNSGTYNNQYQILDTKLFTSGKVPPTSDLLWIIEQIPGYTQSADISKDLVKNKYFPSYNVPYFPFIYNISGYPAAKAKSGDIYSYEKCPRAQIFARDQHKVVTLDDMKSIMRYNDFEMDPLSLGNACNAISARCDLNKKNARPGGGYDCKVADAEMIQSMTTHALNGPTSVQQPPFDWIDWNNIEHEWIPRVWNFSFVEMRPSA